MKEKYELILSVASDPQNMAKTSRERAELAGCSIETYHEAWRDPEFSSRFRAITMEQIEALLRPLF